ncbi:MAG: chemotaxis protein CheW [Phycisphaerae bacterium]|nr:chemotaxis protein CheW [Phycisphaerae bacterium]
MSALTHMVVFLLDEGRFAFPLEVVERIVRVVEVTPLPQAPNGVVGVINIQGRVIPVLDLRCRFGLPPREVEVSDQLLIAHASKRDIALLVDGADVVALDTEHTVDAQRILPGLEYTSSIVKHNGHLILLCDPDALLSLDEQSQLTAATGGVRP